MRWLLVPLAVSSVVLPRSADAQKQKADAVLDACVAAHTAAQQARTAKRLVQARAQLLLCTRPECPAIARDDCSEWLSEVSRDLPSIVLVITDDAGEDLTDVTVTVDGARIAGPVPTDAIPLDPGPHTLRFERDGTAPVERKIVLRVGERNRRVAVRLERKSSALAPKPPTSDDAERETGAPIPAATWVLGTIGLVGLASFGYFALSGESKQSELDDCKPKCSSGDVSSVRTRYIAADISLAVGVLALGGATYFYLNRPSKPEAVRGRDFRIGARATPFGMWASLEGAF